MDARQVIAALGGPDEVATITGASRPTVTKWGTRNRIPARFALKLVDAARARGVVEITAEALDQHLQRRPASSSAQAVAA